MNTIDRDFISSNFSAVNLVDGYCQERVNFNKADLVEKINLWKYILVHRCKAKPQESILIGSHTLNIDYIASIYAAAELSLIITVVDYIRTDDFRDSKYKDPKTQALLPIHIFLHDFPKDLAEKDPEAFSKYIYFQEISERTYSIVDDDINFKIDNQFDYSQAISIMPKPDDILVKATSSGTTNKPKIIEHTHAFIRGVAERNMWMFGGTALHVKNLNHGASAAVTLFPVLANDDVKQHVIYAINEDDPLEHFVKSIEEFREDLCTVSFPYPFFIERFIASSRKFNLNWPNLRVLVLTYTLESIKLAARDGIIKNVTSLFGSNETLGPLFINVFDKENWDKDSRLYTKFDDWYNLELSEEGKLIVELPVYNRLETMNDVFKMEDGFWVHQGRSDLLRINGEDIEISKIDNLNKQNEDFYVIVDTINHCLYIAYWVVKTQQEVNDYISKVESNFKQVEVKHAMQLKKENYYYGFKIDNELLREYFRHHIY